MSEISSRAKWIPVLLSAIHAVLLASGALLLVVAIAARLRHETIADLYTEAFPRFRGRGEKVRIPSLVYVMFISYIVAATELALMSRRRPAGKTRAAATEAARATPSSSSGA
jgi:hypothetical protein